MSENRKFKLKYDQLRENDPAKKDSQSNNKLTETESKFYDTPGSNRTICFAWPDGRKQFFSYSYLVSGELDVSNEMNVITLRFTSDIVTMRGYGLEELFSRLINHTPSLIAQDDPRYADSNDDTYALTEISVMPAS